MYTRRVQVILPARMQAAATRMVYPKLRSSETKLMCRSEWKDGSWERKASTTATMMTKWYSFSGPCGARLVYIICWGTTKDQEKKCNR